MSLSKPAAPGAPPRPAKAPLRPLPELHFPEQLPVSGRRDEIRDAIAAHPVVIVCGETGSGKTTQLPKIAALAGCGRKGLIGHTQPRRIAAHSVAKRIAEELGTPLGEHVGYKVRFNETLQPGASIKLMTDGILLAETMSDPLLRAYDCLIVDEAHERSLNIDFLLGYLKRLLDGPRRDDLKVIVTSATIDATRFAEHFAREGQAAPVIEVSGRVYPVQVLYRPRDLDKADAEGDADLSTRIEEAIDELWRKGPGDVLVFLPGEREIRDAADHLRRALQSQRGPAGLSGRPGGPVEILPLFSRLSAADQQKIFAPGGARRVVLATNVAETSLTVPGIRYVVDSGLARIKRYLFRAKIEQLLIEPVSQASANQRAGRCGRVSDGTCIRLYGEDDFLKRPRFTEPELLRSSLAAVILRMKALKLGEITQFPFVEAPARRAIADGVALLEELHALEDDGRLSRIGREMARLPLDPKASRMLIAARELQCVPQVLVIASALASQDARDRPMDRQQAADEKHRRFQDERGDFLAFLKLWMYWQAQLRDKESHRKLAQKLAVEFISVRKLREWQDVHAQLRDSLRELGWQEAAAPLPEGEEALDNKTAEAIFKALLTGLLGNLGTKGPEDSHYQGTHQTRFVIHPSSGLIKKQPRWLMAGEMVDTGRLYARTVARIDPTWIEQAGSHLIKRHWSEPTWSKNSGQVVAFESGMIYGLTLYAQRRVPYADKEPALARELLIREALVAGEWIGGHAARHLPFIEHNRQLIEQIRKLEDKIRRPDLLVDEQTLFEWFDAQLPADITSGKKLEHWYGLNSRNDPSLLKLSREVLLKKDAGVELERFPKHLKMRAAEFALDYVFSPGSDNDGVTLTAPVTLLNQVDATACEWLVPGFLQDKVEALLKSLPQRHRRHMVPVRHFAIDFCNDLNDRRGQAQEAGQPDPFRGQGLVEALIGYCRERLQIRLLSSDFKSETVPAHLLMNFKLVDEHGRFLASSRMLAQLKADFGGFAQASFQNAQRASAPQALGQGEGRARQAESRSPAGDIPAPGAQAPASAGHFRAGDRHLSWDFGELPELMELEVRTGAGLQTAVGFPALKDLGDACELQVFDDERSAERVHQQGLRRLFILALREPIRFFERNIADLLNMSLAFNAMGTQDELKDQLVAAMIDRACLKKPWPRQAAEFEAAVTQARSRLNLVGQEVARLAAQILAQYQAVQKKLGAIRAQLPKDMVSDLEAQIGALVFKRFLTEVPEAQLKHVPRYLEAITMRLDKWRQDPARDLALSRELLPLIGQWRRLQADLKDQSDDRLIELRWMLEELRVSLFAQQLRTPMPVSVKRLQKALASVTW